MKINSSFSSQLTLSRMNTLAEDITFSIFVGVKSDCFPPSFSYLYQVSNKHFFQTMLGATDPNFYQYTVKVWSFV